MEEAQFSVNDYFVNMTDISQKSMIEYDGSFNLVFGISKDK